MAAMIERDPSSGNGGKLPRVLPAGIALSVTLHMAVLALVVFGVPHLFRPPPPEDSPIAVQLVAIAPETRATQPNPFRPRPDAKPEAPVAAPAPKPEPKPEPPAPAPQPPPAASAPPPPAPPPKPEVKAPSPPPPPAPKPLEARAPPIAPKPAEAKPPPAKPVEAKTPPPKPVEAKAPPPPPPAPEAKPKPKPEPQTARQAPRPAPSKPEPEKPQAKQIDRTAFDKLLSDLEDKTPEPAFDSLLKNLTRQQVAHVEEAPPNPSRMAAASAPSSQPRAPLGSQLTASEIDLIRDQISRCWNIPAGAREANDLVVAIKVSVAPDGRVMKADIVDQGRLADPFFRAAAESARRAFFNPQCTPLRLPAEKYEAWKAFTVDFSPKDIL